MFNIQKYLERFSKNINSIELYKKNILEIIRNNTQIEVPSEDLEIKEYIIYLKSSPAIKNKVFISKNKILEEITKTVPVKVVDIR